ncbi:MAG: DUF2203 domain-containing protein [Armatimonadetes bacterium]|nr:DUF2203 domain-containing protein [Armatimonadota bacterium]
MSGRVPTYFTLEDATRALPDVEQAIRRLRRIRDEAVTLRRALEGQWAVLEDEGEGLTAIGDGQERLDGLAKEFDGLAKDLERRGVILRDLDLGLVDFPARVGLAEVYLCWKVGEASIGFWHGLREGYAGRKPLSALPGRHLH